MPRMSTQCHNFPILLVRLCCIHQVNFAWLCRGGHVDFFVFNFQNWILHYVLQFGMTSMLGFDTQIHFRDTLLFLAVTDTFVSF